MSMFYGILTVFLMMSMIADFSSVLLDIRDHSILFPRPVDHKTISTAKMMHVLIYLAFLTISIVAIPLLGGLIRHGILFFLVSLFNTFLINMFVVGLTAILYLFILRFFDGEKLRDMITYVQIIFSLVVFGGYQLFFRSLQVFGYDMPLDFHWWHIFIFPLWYGANIEMLMNHSIEPFYVLFSILSVVIPLISISLFLKYNHVFEQNLQKLHEQGKKGKKKYRKSGALLPFLLCRSQEERAFFRFASAMMKNERDFKLRVYPLLGFIIIFPIVFISNNLMYSAHDRESSLSYLTIYISFVFIPNILFFLSFSSKAKGAWIYRVTPLKQLKSVFTGTIKAFLVRLFIPVYMFLSVILIIIYGVRITPDLIVVFVNALIYMWLCLMITKKVLPFSIPLEQYRQNLNGVVFIGLIFLAGIFPLLHVISLIFPFGLYIYLLLAIICLVLLWNVAFRLTWEKLLH